MVVVTGGGSGGGRGGGYEFESKVPQRMDSAEKYYRRK